MKTKISKEIEHVLEEMERLNPSSEEYRVASANLKLLCESKKINTPETLIVAATNILGIVLVLYFERANVIASKAFGIIRRL